MLFISLRCNIKCHQNLLGIAIFRILRAKCMVCSSSEVFEFFRCTLFNAHTQGLMTADLHLKIYHEILLGLYKTS